MQDKLQDKPDQAMQQAPGGPEGAGQALAQAGQGQEGQGMALLSHIKHEKKRKFLELFPEVGSVALAATGAGISRWSHYHWLKTDPLYREAFEEDAKQVWADNMEAEMYRRAVKGTDKNVYYKGKRVDVIKEYSDVLLIVGLKSVRPEKYIEKVVQEHVGTVHVQHSYAVALPAGLEVIDVEAEEVKT